MTNERKAAYDGEGHEVGMLTLHEARERYVSARLDTCARTITVGEPLYATEGDACGGCGHRHRSVGAAQACADRHQARVARGDPGGRAYSDRCVVRRDGRPLTRWERDELDHAQGMDW